MTFKSSQFSLFSAFALLGSLIACSGMTPGGGAPTEVAQGGGSVSVGNSLDSGGNGNVPGAGTSPVGGGGSSGEAVPSTQQTTTAIGAPCVISFKVTVKTLRNGSEESCNNSVARLRPIDVATGEVGTMAPPENPPRPQVTLKFIFSVEDSPFNLDETQDTQCVAGRWETVDGFFFRYPGKNLDCSGFQVSAQASWLQGSQTLVSNLFQGPPVPDKDEESRFIPLEVTIDLGYQPNTHNVNVLSNSVLSN